MTSNGAIFVDGDNVPSKNASQIKALGTSKGQILTAKTYGNEKALSNWAACPDFHFIYSGTGKNASDLLLAIDATELTLRQSINTVIIATSDSDFVHLARRLRERGITVLGCGHANANAALRSAYSKFHVLSTENPSPASTNAVPQTKACNLDQQIKKIIAEHSTQGDGMRIVDLAAAMFRLNGTKISELPERTWRKYLSERPTMFALDPRGPESKVRFLPNGF